MTRKISPTLSHKGLQGSGFNLPRLPYILGAIRYCAGSVPPAVGGHVLERRLSAFYVGNPQRTELCLPTECILWWGSRMVWSILLASSAAGPVLVESPGCYASAGYDLSSWVSLYDAHP